MSERVTPAKMPLPVVQPTDDTCPDFDGDCIINFSTRDAFHCWNNTGGMFDTTRPGRCPLIHGPAAEPSA